MGETPSLRSFFPLPSLFLAAHSSQNSQIVFSLNFVPDLRAQEVPELGTTPNDNWPGTGKGTGTLSTAAQHKQMK